MAINRDKSVQVWAVLDKNIYKQLQDIATDQERSISKQAAFIIREYISNYNQKKQQTKK